MQIENHPALSAPIDSESRDFDRELNADRLREECGVFGIYGHPDAAAITADQAVGALPDPRAAPGALEELRQKLKPAPQERLARMVDLNEERTAHILRKWAHQEAS